MISVAEAKKLIFENIQLELEQVVPIQNAHGLCTSKNIFSKIDIPHFPQSSMDGYAIRFEDRNHELTIVGEMRAGAKNSIFLNKNEAVRIFTGAPIPTGADTIVIQEKSTIHNNLLIINDPEIKFGQHIRKQGSDAQKESLAVPQNTILTPAALGYLASIGETNINVYSPPKIGLIVTGDELQILGTELAYGQVYESNSIAIRAALKNFGIKDIEVAHIKDDLNELSQGINEMLNKVDLLIICGGVSVGDYDFVVKAANDVGVKTIFHKIKQKPGKPLFFGTKENKLIFGLPGNPSSALTCLYEYVFLAISQIMHLNNPIIHTSAISTHSYTKKKGLTHFIKAHYENGKVTPLHAQESYRMQSYAQSNCLIILSEDLEELKVNEPVQIHLLPF